MVMSEQNLKINTIIFSKDRACQLNLLLDSIDKYYPNLFNINILYTGSTNRYLNGYERTKSKFPNINWCLEKNMSEDVIALVDQPYPLTMFLTDDSFFFASIYEPETIIYKLSKENGFACFSFRIGANTNRNFIYDGSSGYIIYQWRNYSDGYLSYPMSVDGHVFKTNVILEKMLKIERTMPNVIEGQLSRICAPEMPPFMSCYSQSSLVTCPVNRVQDIFTNWYGKTHPQSQEYFNEQYLLGKKIDLSKLSNIQVTSPHQEFNLELC